MAVQNFKQKHISLILIFKELSQISHLMFTASYYGTSVFSPPKIRKLITTKGRETM
jgi:hypothetical protein